MSDKTEPWKWGDENQPKPTEPPHIEGQRHLCCGYDAYMRPFDKGNWVAYEDYARLKTEVADLKSTADRLKADVERWEFIHRLDSLAIKKQKEVIETLQAQVDFYKKKLENETDYLVKIGLIDQVTHLKSENEALRKELAEAQENYHLVNEMVARLRKEGKQS